MKIYTCNTFEGHYPVGTAAVIAANTKREAKRLLNEELESIGLRKLDSVKKLIELPMDRPCCQILCDGDY